MTSTGPSQTRQEPGADDRQDRLWDYYQNEDVGSFDLSLPRVQHLARRIRARKPGARVLNIGVGGGTFERVALAEGLDVHALDPNERTVERVRAELGLGDRARAGYSQELPFPDVAFDVVVMSEVLEHLDEEVQRATLAELERVLVPGGLFLGTVPAEEDLAAQRVVCPDCGSRFHRWGHLHSFDRAKLEALLAQRFDVRLIERRSFVTLGPRRGLWGRCKGLVRRALIAAGVLGTPADTHVFVFEAEKRGHAR